MITYYTKFYILYSTDTCLLSIVHLISWLVAVNLRGVCQNLKFIIIDVKKLVWNRVRKFERCTGYKKRFYLTNDILIAITSNQFHHDALYMKLYTYENYQSTFSSLLIRDTLATTFVLQNEYIKFRVIHS